MARLKNEHKLLIVRMLAHKIPPSEVINIMKKDHKIEVTPSQVTFYNPENAQGHQLSDEHKELFHKWRAEFMLDFEAVPIANLRVQLEFIQSQVQNLKELAAESRKDGKSRTTVELGDALARQIELAHKMVNGVLGPVVSNAPPGHNSSMNGSPKMKEIEALMGD